MDIRVPSSKPSGLIDGFSSVQALRRIAERTQEHSAKPPEAAPAAHPEAAPGKVSARITRTAVPQKFEVICYECQYTFPVTGRVTDTSCPRCRVKLEKRDYLLDREFGHAIKTIGTVQLRPGGVLKDTTVVARSVILAGDASQAVIDCQLLQLRDGAQVELAKSRFRDLLIEADAHLVIPRTLSCRNIEVRGELDASLSAEGMILVKAGGHLKGSVRTAHLTVEEGGGLTAAVDIGPHVAPPPKPPPAPVTTKAEESPAKKGPGARRNTRPAKPAPAARK